MTCPSPPSAREGGAGGSGLSSSGFLGRASAQAWPGASSIPRSGRSGVHAGRSPWAGRDRRGTPKGAGAVGWRNETSTAGSRWIDFPAARRTRRPGTFWKGGRRTSSADGPGPGAQQSAPARPDSGVCAPAAGHVLAACHPDVQGWRGLVGSAFS